MVTRFCNLVFLMFAKIHKKWHDNANYWPSGCFSVTNYKYRLRFKLGILKAFVRVKIVLNCG